MPNGTTIANAYVQIMPSADGIKGKLSDIMNVEAKNAGQSSGDVFSRVFSNAISAVSSSIKSIGSTIASMTISGGLNRALNIQSSQKMLKTMITDSKDFEGVWNSVTESVNDTAYGLGDMAKVSASIYASGIRDAGQLESVLTMIADTSAMTGRDLSSMGDIFVKVAASGKMTGQELNQLSSSGIPALQMLADSMGVTAEEAKEMVSQGKVGINELLEAFEGEGSAIAGMAKNMGTTFEGSAANIKSAFSKIGTSVLDPFIKDLVPAMENFRSVINGINKVISGDFEKGMEMVNSGLSTLSENALTAATTLINNLGNLFDAAFPIINQLITKIIDSIPSIIMTALPMITSLMPQVFGAIVTAVGNSVPMLLSVGTDIITTITQGISQSIPTFVSSALPMLTDWTGTLRESFGLLVDAGIDLILNLLDGIIASLPTLLAEIPLIVINIAGLINDNIPKIFAMGWEMIKKLALGIWEHKGEILKNMGNIIKAVVSVVQAINWVNLGKQVITFIRNGITNLINAIPDTMRNIVQWAKEKFTSIDWAQVGKDVITAIKNGVHALFQAIPNVVKDIATNVKTKFTSINWGQVGRDIINGIKNGIKNMASSLANAAKEAASAALNGVKNFLGIHSPSTVFRDEIGKNMALGIGEGFNRYFPIDDMTGTLQDSMDDITADSLSSVGLDLASTPNSLPLGDINPNGNTNYGGFNINIYPDKNTNAKQLADELMDEIQKRINQGRMVFGR